MSVGGGFQSTHPRGVRPRALAASAGSWWFQSTHPRGVRPMTFSPSTASCMFQSTHPRGVRQVTTQGTSYLFFVSIHAPAWGATTLRCCTFSALHICFNPRTRVGCDDPRSYIIVNAHNTGFNPRTRVGCDQKQGRGIDWIQRFNPRTRVGCDMASGEPCSVPKPFQSTHPRGVRPW